jgi:hypothetical protein
MDEFEKELLDYLILKGALEIAGTNEETGEFLYQFTPKLKDVMPELYNEHINHVNSELMRLWEKGFVSMNLFDENPMVKLSPKAFDREEISKLSKEDQYSIAELKRILLK